MTYPHRSSVRTMVFLSRRFCPLIWAEIGCFARLIINFIEIKEPCPCT